MNLYLLDFHCSYKAWFLLLLARLKNPDGRNSHKIFQGLLSEYRWVVQKAVIFSTFYSVSTWQSRQCYKITCTPLHLHMASAFPPHAHSGPRHSRLSLLQDLWKHLIYETSFNREFTKCKCSTCETFITFFKYRVASPEPKVELTQPVHQ